MTRALGAGALYALALLSAGTVLGAVRVLLVAPALGEGRALALELPLMLAIAWVACGVILRRQRVATAARPRATMAAVALGCLLAGEAVLAALLVGQSPAAWLAGLARPEALPGLAAQLVAAALPLVRRPAATPH